MFSERYQEKLEALKPTITKAFEDGKIYNPKFKQVKEIITNAIWNLAPVRKDERTRTMGSSGFMLRLRDEYGLKKDDPIWTKVYYISSFSNTHEFKSAKKKLKKIHENIFRPPEWLNKYIETIAPLQEAADLLDNLKPLIVKGREPKPESELKKRKNYFEKKHVAPETLQNVQNTLKEFAEKARANLEKTYNLSLENTANNFENVRQPGQSPSAYNSAKFRAERAARRKDQGQNLNTEDQAAIDYYTEKRSFSDNNIYFLSRLYEQKSPLNRNSYKLVANYKTKIKDTAKQMADDLVAIFIEKNTEKIASVAADKKITSSRTENIHTGRGMLEGDMFFEFADDTKFRVHNKIVWVMNEQGTTFNRFPTTFHNITDSSGKTYKMQSEKWMNESFK